MPLRYAIDRWNGRLIVRAAGAISAADFWSIRDRIAMDPDFDPKMAALFDWAEGDFTRISPSDMQRLATVSVTSRAGRRAFVVRFGQAEQLARFFVATERLPAGLAEVFYDRGVAEQWLGVAGPPITR